MKKIVVSKKYDNKKLSLFVFDFFPNLNKNIFYKALRKKDIRINDVKINSDCNVSLNDEITLYIVDEQLYNSPKYNLEVIYEDDNILVINKPENLSVTEDNYSGETLTSILKKKYGNNINPCHRIDRNTKGLVLFAKNDEALSILLDKFKNQEIEKHYFCKVVGIPKIEHQVLESYLFKDSKKSFVYISDVPRKDYTKIITEYHIIKKDIKNNIAHLDITLHTGKTHQIRAHLAHIGYPILGDGKYGDYETNRKYKLKTQELYSYILKFTFTSPSGKLEYLNGKQIELKIKSEN